MPPKAQATKCWEHKNCKHARSGGCPAYPHHGDTCYMIRGTFCRNEVQGAYAEKIAQCRQCDFYARSFGKAA